MALESGSTLGHYKILAPLGAGGMGEVYRAKDLELGREVAIKVLPETFSEEPARMARFGREAKVLAGLNHANIATLYSFEADGSIRFLVMEYLEGETLEERLKKGALPIARALENGSQIGQAIDAAHKAGVVHRDLKPGNVMLTKTGVKVLDFGLAKSIEAGPLPANTQSPTMMQPITVQGSVVGTPLYMAPEQLEGKDTDARTDIWALGCVLYEMVTGKRAFAGSSNAKLIADIMTAEPPSVRELQPTAPPFLDHLLGKCLAKDPEDRWRSAQDLLSELRWLISPGADASGPPQQPVPSAAASALRRTDYRIEYFVSEDGASVAAARGGRGRPLFVVPGMVDTIETSWATYAEAFSDREVILYDRRGTGLSERDSLTADPEPYLQDGQAVLEGFELEDFDLLGTLLATVEASALAARNAERISRLVLRAPVIGMADWASIPAVRAALAAMDHDWDYFVESFAQLVVGWGDPKGRQHAQRFRTVTTRDELRAIFDAFHKLDLTLFFPRIRASTLVEHHPTYFFPDTYSRRIAALIGQCQMAIYSGEKNEFINNFSIARAFLTATGSP